MDNDKQTLFHPINESEEVKNPVTEHFQKHYRKHLFGLGILFGIALFKLLSIAGSYLGIAGAEKTNADYKPSAIETAIQTFDQLEGIARQRDAFFHQNGKIYSYTGETFFHGLDTKFHILDNAYRSATDTNKRIKIAEELTKIISQQSILFQATQDISLERNLLLQELNNTFHDLQKQIANK